MNSFMALKSAIEIKAHFDVNFLNGLKMAKPVSMKFI